MTRDLLSIQSQFFVHKQQHASPTDAHRFSSHPRSSAANCRLQACDPEPQCQPEGLRCEFISSSSNSSTYLEFPVLNITPVRVFIRGSLAAHLLMFLFVCCVDNNGHSRQLDFFSLFICAHLSPQGTAVLSRIEPISVQQNPLGVCDDQGKSLLSSCGVCGGFIVC